MQDCLPSLLDSGDLSIAWIAENLRHAWLSPIVTAISDLGTTGAVMFITSFAYWCWHKEHSRTLLYGVLLSSLANSGLKEIVRECRPSQSLHLETITDGSFSFPSGHAQVTIILWWGLAYYVRSKVLSPFFMIVGILVALSRPYLGVHYIHDIVAGSALGAVILILCLLNEKHNILKLDRLPLWTQTLLVILFLMLCGLVIDSHSHVATASGVFFGAWFGSRLEEQYVHFTPSFSHPKLLQYALLGFGVAVVIWKGGNYLKHTLPPGYSIAFQYLQYTLLGLWIMFGAPLFVKRTVSR